MASLSRRSAGRLRPPARFRGNALTAERARGHRAHRRRRRPRTWGSTQLSGSYPNSRSCCAQRHAPAIFAAHPTAASRDGSSPRPERRSGTSTCVSPIVPSALGEVMRDQRIGMAMPQPVLRLEQRDRLHVLAVARGPENAEPVFHRMAAGLLDGGEAGGGALDLLGSCHGWVPRAWTRSSSDGARRPGAERSCALDGPLPVHDERTEAISTTAFAVRPRRASHVRDSAARPMGDALGRHVSAESSASPSRRAVRGRSITSGRARPARGSGRWLRKPSAPSSSQA